MFSSDFRNSVSQDATSHGQSNPERLIKSGYDCEKPDSEDSGNCSEAEEEQNTNRATRLEFQLTQSLLSKVKANENSADANSGKQAYIDLPRMNFIINGKTISKDFVGQLCDRYNQELQSNKRQVAKHVLIEMFKHAEAEVPDDSILEELVTNCNQAGYDGSLLLQLFPIFFEHNLQLPNTNDRKISIICNSQDSLNIQYCLNMPVTKLDTNMEICRLDAILEFALKSQDGKVEYKDGKVTLTIPEQLKNYKSDGKSLLGYINRHFKDADNAVAESLEATFSEGPKSFVLDLPAEVDSDSFDIIPENAVFDLGHIPELIKKAVDDKDVNALANHIGFFQGHVTDVSSKEGLSVVEKTLKIVSGFTKEQGKAWSSYPTVPIASHMYSAKQQYYDGYISHEDYEKVKNLERALCKIKSDLIKRSSNDHNEESRVKNAQDTSAMLNETPTSSQAVGRKQLNTKESKDQQLQRNVVDKGENIIVNKKASQEAIGNDYRRGKMGKRSKKKGVTPLASFVRKKISEIISEGNDNLNLEEEFKDVLKNGNHNLVLKYVKSQEGPFKDKVVAFLTLQKNKKNGAQINGKQSTNPSNTVLSVQPTTPETPNASSSENSFQLEGDQDTQPLLLQSSVSGDVEGTEASANAAVTIPEKAVTIPEKVDSLVSDKDVTDGSDNEFVKVSPPPENNVHFPQSIRVRDSFGYTPLKVAHERNITVKTRNAQNLQSAVLSSQQLASRNVIEIFNKHGREDFTPLTLKLTVQEFLNNGISEIQLPASNGCITFNLNVINEASPEGLQNIVKVLTDLYKNGALNDRTRNAIGTGAQDDIDGYRLSLEEGPCPILASVPMPNPILTPTPAPTPNPILTPTPEPTPQPTPALKPTLIPSVANKISKQEDDTQTNGKLPNNPGNGSITATQNTQKSNWPTVATWTFAVAGILAGAAAPAAYFAFSVSLLTTGIIAGVAACCLIAATAIYCCTPKSSVESKSVTKLTGDEFAAQQTVN